MKLISGSSPWSESDQSTPVAKPLDSDVSTEVLVIGAGAIGALIADALAAEEIPTVVLDRREPASGSTQASTSLLQYDLDVPLFKLVERLSAEWALRAFQLGVDSPRELEERLRGLDVGFEKERSLYVAASPTAVADLKREFEARLAAGLTVAWATADELRDRWGLHAAAAIVSENAAQVDPVKLTAELLGRTQAKGTRIFAPEKAIPEEESSDGIRVRTNSGNVIRCRYVVHAGGYEAAELLPANSVKSHATFAFLSTPVAPPEGVWPDRCLLWEFAWPYLYARRTGDRILVGGEDVERDVRTDCKPLLASKTAALREKFSKWIPGLDLEVDSSWCGPILTTSDGLGFIGPKMDGSRVLLALCYGGNGMTHGVAAARLIIDRIKGIENADAELFRVRRFAM